MNSLMVLDKVKEDEDQFITDLIETKGANLPEKIDEVLNVFEFTDWKAKAWKTMADKLSRLEDQQEAYHSALRSGQQWGIAALYSQKRMGEITRDINPYPNQREYNDPQGGLRKKEHNDGPKAGITRHTWKDAERIAAHPEILDRVIETAKNSNEIPTKTAVLNTIRAESAKERALKQNKKQADKLDNQRPRAVADYYEAIKGFKSAIEFATIAAERGKFAPEGINLLQKKHNEIKDMMNKLEELI